MKIRPAVLAAIVLSLTLLALAGCSGPKRVVLYTSVSRAYAEPVIQSFEKVTGARVQVRYGTDEDLAARIVKEKSAPGADVYWNAGILQTLRLAKAGALESFEAPSAVDLPYAYKDTDHLWTMVGFRARVLLLNDALVPGDGPSSILQLAAPQWAGRTGMASPLAGGSLAQAAALYQVVGRDRAMAYYRALAAGGAHFGKHDAGVAGRVARGELAAGLVDSDAATAALKRTPDSASSCRTGTASARSTSLPPSRWSGARPIRRPRKSSSTSCSSPVATRPWSSQVFSPPPSGSSPPPCRFPGPPPPTR